MNEKRSNSHALIGVSIVDGLGSPTVHDAVLIVTNGRISEIARRDSYVRRDGVIEHDLQGMWCMPGLIDAHIHLAGGRADMDDQEMGVVVEPMLVKAIRSVYQAQAVLKRGFTSVRDVSWNGLYLKRVFSEGELPGPKVVACGPGLTRTGGHADLHQYAPDYVDTHGVFGIVADGEDGVVLAVRRLLREGADAIKIFASGGDNWPHDRNGDVHYSPEEMRAAVDEAHRQKGTVVMCHAENATAIRMAIEAGVDTIEHGEDLDDDLVSLMATTGTILVPTLQLIVNWHRDFAPPGDGNQTKSRPDAFLYRDHYHRPDVADAERYRDQAIESFQRAQAGGVKIALGSDTVFEPLTPYGEYSALELMALVEHGMTPDQAIVAATSTASEALGMSNIIGSIEVGKQADLLIVRQDPTQGVEVLYDASNIHLTFCDGVLTIVDGNFVW
ncbi:amidohydrolase family protein [Microbacterium sp. PMB16]|uniref:metal-dependent hydrolase family protein n=1 Tax=Microbacterium sp. PMB16 TaxID=3120157 RepID=UPI003F4B05F8